MVWIRLKDVSEMLTGCFARRNPEKLFFSEDDRHPTLYSLKKAMAGHYSFLTRDGSSCFLD